MQRQKFQGITYVALTLVLICLALASTARAAEYKVLYKFQGGVDGANPYASLIFDAVGNLYGTTNSGGVYGYGTAFKLTPNPDGSWRESVIHSFRDEDGREPVAGLIFDGAGNLYGSTYSGGAYSGGTAFKLTPNPDGSWSESVIHSFGFAEGAYVYANLISDSAGNLYGTTPYGGDHSGGTAFKLTPNPDGSWSESIIHSFSRGARPFAGLIFDGLGNLYGMTSFGGVHKDGTVFRLTPNPDGSWTKAKLHAFKGADGRYPYSGLILDAVGNLYGTTYAGGAYDCGTVFKLIRNSDGSWTRSKLHAFRGHDGSNPYYAGLILDAAGNLYGTTFQGGAYGDGTVFRLTSNPGGSWTRTRLHTFKGSDGERPYAGLTVDAVGNLYGTTGFGGKGYGVVFRITP